MPFSWPFLFVVALLGGVAGVALGSGYLAGRIAGRIRRLPGVRRVPILGVRPVLPSLPIGEEGADLLAYPGRLAELQDRLVERHRAVQQQIQILSARRDQVRAKGGRDDLTKKYDADVAMLDRRAASMRRVQGLVWKTYAVLMMRVHVAITCRRRPSLGALPEPTGRKGNFAAATASWHSASAAVTAYRDDVVERGAAFEAGLLPPPVSAELDDAMRTAVEEERIGVRAAYQSLAARMDRLADNLTFVADHFGARAVVDADVEELASDGGPSHLLEEVAAAVRGLDDLAGQVDPAVVNAAVTNLAEDITHLEEAGLEAEAEAEAHLEVERLLGQFSAI